LSFAQKYDPKYENATIGGERAIKFSLHNRCRTQCKDIQFHELELKEKGKCFLDIMTK
jgi:hypothetical protein